MNWILFWLFFHIAGAIIAFGPSFVFPLLGPMIGKEPQHAHFGVMIMEAIEKRLILPVALTMLVSGGGLIFATSINPTGSPWLGAGVILYLIQLGIALGIQLPATAQLARLTAQGPPPGGPPPGAPPGPPPEIAALTRRSRMVGMFMTLNLFIIIFLMVVKPGGTTVF